MSDMRLPTTTPTVYRPFEALRPVFGNPLAIVGAVGCSVLLLVAVFGPLIAPYDPIEQSILARFAPSSAAHWLGADEYGRDMFSRILYASRASLVISLSSVAVGLIVGVALGILAAYRGGILDAVLSELASLLLSFPTIVIGILVLVSLGPGSANVIVALALSFVPRFIRLARAETLVVMQRSFIDASKTIGASDFRIMLRHIMPNVIGTAIVSGALWTATALRAEATLSFLGLGVPLPWPSWGNLVADGMPNMFSNPELVLYPCLAIVFAVISFNILGDVLRDYFDPHLAGR
ncbi:ABC transporter permease [Microvirga massiliensis]|uniref:ABC transporter permease n=1 Tax=Microvirga massiliensis TaxID=1033741 RepID=UPI00062B35BA|nr:ABC transporter permease [Microvirga massiliensis]